MVRPTSKSRHEPCGTLGRPSIRERCRSANLTMTPRTIRDALSPVESIGGDCLCVDGLCVDQADNEDRHANTSRMCAIYENAVLIIIAANGQDAEAGLNRLKPTQIGHERPFTFTKSDIPFSLLSGRENLEAKLRRTK